MYSLLNPCFGYGWTQILLFDWKDLISVESNIFSPLHLTESPGEVCRKGDSPGIRSGHDSVQGTEAAGKSWAAEVRWWGHHWWH